MNAPSTDLEILRFELDLIDDEILRLLLARFGALRVVAEIKARDGLPAHDPERETRIRERLERHLAGVVPEVRTEILEIMRGVVERGRGYVSRVPRHDRVDEEVDVDPGAGPAPRANDPG